MTDTVNAKTQTSSGYSTPYLASSSYHSSEDLSEPFTDKCSLKAPPKPIKNYKKQKPHENERTSSEEPPDKPKTLVVRTAKLDTESERLKNILACIDPDTLYSYTMAKLGNRDPKIIEALCTLLPIKDLLTDSSANSSDSEKSEKSNNSKTHSTYTLSSNNDSGITTCSYGTTSIAKIDEELEFSNQPGKSISLIGTTDFDSTLSTSFFKKTESVVLPEKKKASRKKSTPKQMQHCVRCHKNFDGKSRSSAEWRCKLPHPEDMVVKLKDIKGGADFKCMACCREFRILGMNFYEEGTNSMMTGFCQIDKHTTDPKQVKFRSENGPAQTCEGHGCVEFYV